MLLIFRLNQTRMKNPVEFKFKKNSESNILTYLLTTDTSLILFCLT